MTTENAATFPTATPDVPQLSSTVPVIGIDPGQSGGIAFLASDGTVRAYKMPETERDTFDLLADLGSYAGVRGIIEKVGPMPKQGVSSTWKFGQHYGSLRAFLIAIGIPFDAVAPGVWQKSLGCLSHGDKNVTKKRAQELYPALKITHATADALLIATYGRRNGHA